MFTCIRPYCNFTVKQAIATRLGTEVDLRMVFYSISICAIIYWPPTYIPTST